MHMQWLLFLGKKPFAQHVKEFALAISLMGQEITKRVGQKLS